MLYVWHLFGTITQRRQSGSNQGSLTQISELGGEVKSMYALLGTHDLVLIVNFPDISQALKASVLLTRLLGIQFSTHPAVTVEEFDALMSEM